jgi:hypothetical protein
VGAAAGWATRTDVRVGAEKLTFESELVARSRMVPELRSRLVEIAMPSVSNSRGSEATVYRKSAVLESDIETKFAYSVAEPTVSVKRGVPETVTDSLKTIVKVGVFAGIYVEFAGAATDEMAGAVRSMITVFAELTVGGPVDVPVMELALS